MDFKTMTSFRIVTLGCKVNQYESAWLREALCDEGWLWADKGPADVTVINTCIVTQTASRQSRQEIRKAIRRSPGGLVAAVGCYAQVFPEELLEIEKLGLIVGNSSKGALVDLLERAMHGRPHAVVSEDFGPAPRFDPMPVRHFSGRTRAFLKIQDGCESFCSYCIVPFARGPSRSLPMEKVLEGMERYCTEGYREIVLTGIHLGLYQGGEPGCDVTGLLKRIQSEKYPARIRISSMEPNEVTEEMIEMVAEGRSWICRHLHLALQSGDDSILASMNRPYTAGDFASLVRKIHEASPQICVGADVMCGFPGENDQTFENTRSLLANLPMSYLHVFRYSRRPGTRAAEFPLQVHPEQVKEMAEGMRALGRGKRSEFNRASLGGILEVLREGRHAFGEDMAVGTSDNYVPVIFRLPAKHDHGPLLKVRAEQVTGDRVEGTFVNSSYPE
jgi:threonylcarbamoyladenosine tRNA methylthiotransferase MtaB